MSKDEGEEAIGNECVWIYICIHDLTLPGRFASACDCNCLTLSHSECCRFRILKQLHSI
jgi:hypothetical protein